MPSRAPSDDTVEQADVDLREMCVERPNAAAVCDDDGVAEAAQRRRPHDPSGTGRRHRRPRVNDEVEAGMERAAPGAEPVAELSDNGPAESERARGTSLT